MVSRVPSRGAADAVCSSVFVAGAGRGHYDHFVVPPAVPVAASIGVDGDGDSNGNGGRWGEGDAMGGLRGATALKERVLLVAEGAKAASARSPLPLQRPFRRRR